MCGGVLAGSTGSGPQRPKHVVGVESGVGESEVSESRVSEYQVSESEVT